MSGAAEAAEAEDIASDGSSKPSAKRRKTISVMEWDGHDSAAAKVSLGIDVMSLVMDFLGPRDLFHVAMCSKALLATPTVTQVVKSALFHGGPSALTIEYLQPLYKLQSIYPVSPVRLLRLVNGRKCEKCLRARRRIQNGQSVLYCKGCFFPRDLNSFEDSNSYLRRLPNEDFEMLREQIIRQARLAFCFKEGGFYVATRHQEMTTVHGKTERWGSLIVFDDFETVKTQYAGNLAQFMSEKDPELPSTDQYEEFLKACQMTEARLKQLKPVDRQRIKSDARTERTSQKIQQVEKKVSQLREMLDPAWRDILLRRGESGREGRDEPCIEFFCDAVDMLLFKYVLSPTKLIEKHMVGIAEKIRLLVDRLETFRSGWFLSDTEAFDLKIRSQLQNQYPDLLSLIRGAYRDKDFYSELEQGCYFTILDRWYEHNFGFLFMPDNKVESHPSYRFNEEELYSSAWSFTSAKNEDKNHPIEVKLRMTYAAFAESIIRIIQCSVEFFSFLAQLTSIVDKQQGVQAWTSKKMYKNHSALRLLLDRKFYALLDYLRDTPTP
jgi:hypothetical protein